MTDNGLAALAEALEHEGDACSYDAATDSLRCPGSEAHIGLARRLLGERGVFLPEGLGLVMVGMAKEIAALRAALPSEATLEASIDLMGQMAVGGSLGPTGRQLAKRLAERLRAALAAKETP